MVQATQSAEDIRGQAITTPTRPADRGPPRITQSTITDTLIDSVRHKRSNLMSNSSGCHLSSPFDYARARSILNLIFQPDSPRSRLKLVSRMLARERQEGCRYPPRAIRSSGRGVASP